MDLQPSTVAAIGLTVLGAVVIGYHAFQYFGGFMNGVRRGLYGARAPARIVDVAVFDTMHNNDHDTHYRVVVQFTPEHGELVIADLTLDPTAAQKDMLLPDNVLMIEYNALDPQNFRFDFAAGVQPADALTRQAAAAPPPTPVKAPERSLYGRQR